MSFIKLNSSNIEMSINVDHIDFIKAESNEKTKIFLSDTRNVILIDEDIDTIMKKIEYAENA